MKSDMWYAMYYGMGTATGPFRFNSAVDRAEAEKRISACMGEKPGEIWPTSEESLEAIKKSNREFRKGLPWPD